LIAISCIDSLHKHLFFSVDAHFSKFRMIRKELKKVASDS
jgi:hypothetical protein